MNVLFLMFVYPDGYKSYNMYTTLASEFVKDGHKVIVIAPAEKFQKTTSRIEMGVEVVRVRTLPLKNVSPIIKGFSNLLLPCQFRRAIRGIEAHTRFDLIILPTPPITLAGLAGALRKRHNSQLYLILRDIFPQNAIDLGFFKEGGLVHRYFRSKEKKLYRVANHIGCMSPRNIQYVLKNNPWIELAKLHELKNFQIQYYDDGSLKQEIRQKYDLENKYVVVFGGNMGKPQQLENVIELARRCQKFTDVLFLLLGEGVMVERLRKDVRRISVTNVRIVNTIPKREYQKLLSSCDLGLISLNMCFTIPNIPSKTLDYFNVGLPVLASIDKATDFNLILEESGAGLWSYAGEHDAFMSNFELLYHNADLRKKMAENGRAYFLKNLTPDTAYRTIISTVTKSYN